MERDWEEDDRALHYLKGSVSPERKQPKNIYKEILQTLEDDKRKMHWNEVEYREYRFEPEPEPELVLPEPPSQESTAASSIPESLNHANVCQNNAQQQQQVVAIHDKDDANDVLYNAMCNNKFMYS